MNAKTLLVRGKSYALDELGCLKDFHDWEPEFAEAMAEEAGIIAPLTGEHMKILRYLHEAVESTGRTQQSPYARTTVSSSGSSRSCPPGITGRLQVVAQLIRVYRHARLEHPCRPPQDLPHRRRRPSRRPDGMTRHRRAAGRGARHRARRPALQVIRFLRAALASTTVPTSTTPPRAIRVEEWRSSFPLPARRGELAGLSLSRPS
jgi:sulfur relay (sulfurtransferase) DsrC/TusE family protein